MARLPSPLRFYTAAGNYVGWDYPETIPESFSYQVPAALPLTPSQIQVSPTGEWTYVESTPQASNNWLQISGDTSLSGDTNYIVNSLTRLNLLLPPNANMVTGNRIIIHDQLGSGFQVTQSNTQQIRYGSKQTSLGITGTVVSSDVGDTLELIFLVSNWIVGPGSIGNFDVR